MCQCLMQIHCQSLLLSIVFTAFRKTTKDKNQKKAEQNKKRKAQADQGPGQATGAEDDAGDADTAADVDAEDEHGGCT